MKNMNQTKSRWKDVEVRMNAFECIEGLFWVLTQLNLLKAKGAWSEHTGFEHD